MSTFYVSFATDETFLGACWVQAPDAKGAHERILSLGIHPGGEALLFELLPGDPVGPFDVLHDLAAIEAATGPAKKLKELANETVAAMMADPRTSFVCADHGRQTS